LLTIRATLEPNGHLQLPATVHCEKPMQVLVTFLDDSAGFTPSSVIAGEKGSVAATLALLQSPEFRKLPKSDAAEIEQRIQSLRDDWGDD
jgi:hypothetical protein